MPELQQKADPRGCDFGARMLYEEQGGCHRWVGAEYPFWQLAQGADCVSRVQRDRAEIVGEDPFGCIKGACSAEERERCCGRAFGDLRSACEEALLAHGKVAGRARAFRDGRAYRAVTAVLYAAWRADPREEPKLAESIAGLRLRDGTAAQCLPGSADALMASSSAALSRMRCSRWVRRREAIAREGVEIRARVTRSSNGVTLAWRSFVVLVMVFVIPRIECRADRASGQPAARFSAVSSAADAGNPRCRANSLDSLGLRRSASTSMHRTRVLAETRGPSRRTTRRLTTMSVRRGDARESSAMCRSVSALVFSW